MVSMKSTFSFLTVCMVGMLLVLGGTQAGKAQTKQRVGVYDSRAVALVYFQQHAQERMHGLMQKRAEAVKNEDEKEVARLEKQGQLIQAMMHDRVFGKGSANEIMDEMQDAVRKIAVEEQLPLVVSKWELVYQSGNLELVDITDKLVGTMNPNEKMQEGVQEMRNTEPVKEAFLIDD